MGPFLKALRPPVAVHLPQPDVSDNRDAPQIGGALPSAATTEAQLTAKALRALDTRTDLNQQFLKVLIVDQSTDKNVVASLLVQTLLRV